MRGRALFVAAAFACACAALPRALAAQQLAQQQVHAFDFQFGAWNVSIRARRGSGWTTYTGTHVVTPIWNGTSNYGVLEASGPAGHIEGMQLRLYSPRSHQWELWFAQSKTGALGNPSRGGFANGRGEFYERETRDGVTVLERTVTSNIKANSYRDEIATSSDGGKTWKTTWIATYVRLRR